MDQDAFNQLSPLVGGRLPEFIKVDHPTLIAFLSAYYEWLQIKDRGGLIVSPMLLQDVVDIDSSMDEFITHFKKEYILDFPETLAIAKSTGKPVDSRKLMKNIKSFYRAKGTEKSYEFLFRILYDTAVEFYYPKKDILRVSDGKWYAKTSIKISNVLGNKIFESAGRIVYQRDSGGKITSSAKVVDVSLYQQGQYDVAELTIVGRNGSFVSGSNGIYYDIDDRTEHELRIYNVVKSVTIDSAGSGYSVGDRISFTALGDDTGEGAYGIVSLVSYVGEIRRIRIENFGVNYNVAPTVSAQSIGGTGFAGTAVVSPICEAEGGYLNSDGRISTNKVLQDNHYYQDFSYVLKTEVVIDEYRDAVRRLVHPAGTAMFGQILIKRCSRENLMNSSALIRYEVPIIGHYVPYTFVSYDNLQDWFMVGMTGASADSGILISAGYNPSLHDPLIKGDPSGWDLPDASYASRIFLLGSDYPWVGNPISSAVDFVGASGPTYPPLGQTGFQNADPFWIVYEHPNRKIKGQNIARIWKNQMDEVVGIPVGSSPDYYYGAGWDEFVGVTGSSLGVKNPGVSEETAYQWKSDFENDPTLEHKYGFLKYSDSSEFRKITARSFFEMPIGEEFDCRVESTDTYAMPIVTITKPLQGHIIRSLRPDQPKTLTVHWVVQNYENLIRHGAANFRVTVNGNSPRILNLNERTVSWSDSRGARDIVSDGIKEITIEVIDAKGMNICPNVGGIGDTVSINYIGRSTAAVAISELPTPNNDLSAFGGLSDPLQYRPNLTSNLNTETGGLNDQDNSEYGDDSDGFTNYFISPPTVDNGGDPNGGATGATNASVPSDFFIMMDRAHDYSYNGGGLIRWVPYFDTGSLTANAYYDTKYKELGVKDWHLIYEGDGMWQNPLKPVIKRYYASDGATAHSTITINRDNVVDFISTNMGIQPGTTEEHYIQLDFETDFDGSIVSGYNYDTYSGTFRSVDRSQSQIAYPLPFWEKKQTGGGIDYLELKGVTGPRDIKVSAWQFGGLVTNSGHLVMFYDKGTTFNTQEWATAEIPNRSDFSSLSVGYDHCIALTTSGTMVGWGLKNSDVGLLGTKAAMDQITAAGKTVTKIDAGAQHGLALLNDGQVVAWGTNAAAQLSDPDRYWTTAGYAVQGDETYKYYQDRATRWVSEIRQYRCGVFADGNRYSGCESPNGSLLPEHNLYSWNGTSVTAGSYLAAGLTQGWEFDTGAPYDYQFSRATTNSLTGPNGLTHINYGGGGWTAAAGATSIFGKSNKTYTDISAGRSHCLILASDGRIETWGDNYYYTVSGSGLHNKDRRTGAGAFRREGSGDGIDIPTGENTAPTVKSLKRGQTGVAAIGTSYYTNMVVRSDGSLFAWDRNEWGESLPSGGLPSMTAGGATGFVAVDGGYHHCCAVRSNGTVACWGAGDLTKTNDGTVFNYGQSIVPDGLGTFKKVVCGQDYTIGVLSNDKVIAWGHIENLLRNHVFVAPTLFPNNDDRYLNNLNFVVDTGLTYGMGPNNTRASREITETLKYLKTIFPNVKFGEWGYPSAYNYFDVYGKNVDGVDWPHATPANQEKRIQRASEMFKPVLTECDFVSFYAYDTYPSQKSIDDGLVPEPDGPYAAKNSWYGTDTNQFLSDQNDSQHIAGAEVARRIRNTIGKPNQLLTATISMYSPPGTGFKSPDQQPLLPAEEIIDFIKRLRTEQPSMNGVSFWTASDYHFGLALRSQTLPGPLDSDWAQTIQYWYTHVPGDWRGTAEEYRDGKIAEYTSYSGFQRSMRKSIITLYWDKVDVIANGTYSGWGDPRMRYDTMVRVNEYWLAMIREIRKITA